MTSETERQAAADALTQAATAAMPCPPPTRRAPGLTLAEAYDIQHRLAASRTAAGARALGYKIGLTARAIQRLFDATEPDYGVIFDDALYGDGATLEAARFIEPMLEMELCFVMGDDLAGPGCLPHDVVAATASVSPALEIIDNRTEAPRNIADVIADNGVFAAAALGGRPVRPYDVDLRWIAGTMARNGAIEETGVSAVVMGHPAAGVAWLVNALAARGGGLKAGDIVLSGSLVRPVPMAAGYSFTADFGPLGAIGIRMV